METKTFLGELLPSDGYYCMVALRPPEVVQKFYSSIDDVIDAAQYLDAKGFNAYFALATFQDTPDVTIKVSQRGDYSIRETKGRRVKNTRYLKSLFLDLD